MLAVVQPYSASPDVGHRARSSLSSVSSSRSASSNLASIHPPSLQRHQTLPPAHPPPRRTPTPPLKPPTSPTSLPGSDSPFDIHSYPATDLLKLLALLLTHIATTNDRFSPTSSSPNQSSSQNPASSLPDPIDAPPIWHTLTTASRGAVSTPAATLTFHARNIPTISLEAYLLRILKYCPTTNHVFLSLLVYFDRMSKLSADAVGRAFVIDSYNIHRLVIAGVTVASKFFSDVFYTNSRYAKVGGLPLPELNQLELQFLLLNDFRLVISSTEMQQY
ncbi:cyclin-domain-containing protein, partial [Phlegmacium glaucopus]